jgi:2-octaprenyl-6-methoxyphenol hydroxylase
MARLDTDILIAGGGIAGLTAAAACATAGYRVIVVTPEPPITTGGDAGSDLRSTAFLQLSAKLFDRAGLWDRMTEQATPLNGLRIVDSTGWPPVIRDSRAFQSSDVVEGPFGWNLLNWQTLSVLVDALDRLPDVQIMYGATFTGMVTRDAEVIARISTGDTIRTKLVLGADGRGSAVRDAAGIDTHIARYGQKALAFVVGHTEPHRTVSTEIYNQGGPFTTIPMPDQNGAPASGIVWMNPGAKADTLSSLEPTELADAATERSCEILGPMTLLSHVGKWPVISLRAQSLTGQRVALIAEAAHVVPPIGAQGLNTSLADIAAFLDAAQGCDDPGADDVLARYAKARTADITARVAAIDVFNRITMSGAPVLQTLRLYGLKAAYDAAPVRKAIMRAGMGG